MFRLLVSLLVLLVIGPIAAPAETLDERIRALITDFKGTVSLYAKNLNTGQDFALGADTRVRTASTIKLPILCALQSLVAVGRTRWDERLVLDEAEKIPGSGVLKSLTGGTELTVRDLAMLMIIVSDNSATNLILDRITADAVNEYLDAIGLTATRLNRKVRGGRTEGWSKAGLLEENSRYGLGVSTPREMVALVERLHRGTIVSPEASADTLDILTRQQVKAGIGRHAPADWVVASKSGSLDALRSDVGLVHVKDVPVALAITVDDMPEADYSPDNAGDKLIWQLTSLLVPALSAPRSGDD